MSTPLTTNEINKKEARYYQHLAHLKKDIQAETSKRKKKKKKFKPNQTIMINFINNVTTKAEFSINGKKIILRKGTIYGGFMHFIEKHYCKGCPGEINMHDMLNMDLVISKGLVLNNIGVTNKENIVYSYKNGQDEHNIILKQINEDELVISFYSID